MVSTVDGTDVLIDDSKLYWYFVIFMRGVFGGLVFREKLTTYGTAQQAVCLEERRRSRSPREGARLSSRDNMHCGSKACEIRILIINCLWVY